ncbi:hypothetical protein M409DRAFT_57835 [Zasmidium cellare ATCC 36951]|uniref:Zn(2)-C6 fungal-type domain-containing protein n=1 Tax=Zasmidium cellare ATCC 36951 TaxID=1080233 RepID=A0A6A6C7Z7_ZASCE|nr:uncharacterized protein M409DRAFT_57835 [Zasmidium cellare ATCC 36951]KAF2163175.1 hypothetical protein M409DRAFT_57835 [Zasmidium cellare ATCC 36951]
MPRTHDRKAKNTCQRCRRRRIKCDGAAPSCAQCVKAKVTCIEGRAIGGRENLPQAFLDDSLARLAALEDLVRTRLPDVDLSDLCEDVAGPPQPPRRRLSNGIQQESLRTDYDGTLISSNLAVPRLHGLRPLSTKSGARLFPNITHHRQHQVLDGGGDQALLTEILDLLPARSECEGLIQLFFSHNHAAYPVLHEPSIAVLVEAVYVCASLPTDCPLLDTGWPTDVPSFAYNGEVKESNSTRSISIPFTTAAAILFHVLGIASYVQAHRHRLAADPHRYGGMAFHLTSIAMGDITLPSVQLAVLAVQHGYMSQHHGSPWALLQLGMVYAVDLGLHLDGDGTGQLTSITTQIRRRAFFCVYRLDRLISSVQGRPLAFADDCMDFSFPSSICNEIDDRPSDPDQVYLVVFEYRVQWARLVSEIKSNLYRTSTSALPLLANVGRNVQEDMLIRLDTWLAQSMSNAQAIQSQTRQLHIELEIDYYYAIGLLYQPSVGCPTPDAAALRRCHDSAAQCLRLSWSLHGESCLLLTWLTTQCISLAGSTMAYCVWNSHELRSSLSITELSSDFRLCSSLLALAGEWWPSAKKGGQSFQRLADSTIQLVVAGSGSQRPPTTSSVETSTGVASYSDSTPLGEGVGGNIEDMLNEFLQEDFQLPDYLRGYEAAAP